MISPKNEYEAYLKLPELLSLQQPRSHWLATDVQASEMFFIVVHQSAELLLKQVVDDLNAVARSGEDGVRDWAATDARLVRSIGLISLLTRHVEIMLEHLPREHFLAFRDLLGAASAGGSVQFAEVFALFGTDGEPGALRYGPGRSGRDAPPIAEDLRSRLQGLEQTLRRWQLAHIALVEWMIGDTTGTGGTAGAAWLRSRLLPVTGADTPDQADAAAGSQQEARAS